jgi:hypothetical protein
VPYANSRRRVVDHHHQHGPGATTLEPKTWGHFYSNATGDILLAHDTRAGLSVLRPLANGREKSAKSAQKPVRGGFFRVGIGVG